MDSWLACADPERSASPSPPTTSGGACRPHSGACSSPPAASTARELRKRLPPRRRRSGPLRKSGPSDPVLLEPVGGRVALRRRRSPGPADVAKRYAVRGALEPMADRAPRPHVLRLLLHPQDLAHVRVLAHEFRSRVDRERIQLLEPPDGDVPRARACLVPDDVVVDLPRAEDEA